jgi:hypothetical protein
LYLESHVASPKVESEKGGFGEWKRWRVIWRVYWNIFFGLFPKFCDKELYRESPGDALRIPRKTTP